jgi:hypothetical protein
MGRVHREPRGNSSQVGKARLRGGAFDFDPGLVPFQLDRDSDSLTQPAGSPGGAPKGFALNNWNGTDHCGLFQLHEFCFGFAQDGNIRVSLFPQYEEILESGAGLGGIALQGVGAGQAEMC